MLYLAVQIIVLNVLHLVPTERRERKKENYISKIRYLNSYRLKQDSVNIERNETGKSLNDLAELVRATS